jgi:DNA-binding NarL/FixJ family response regulator
MDELNGFALLLVDDHPLFRDGLALALTRAASGLRVQAAPSVDAAMELLAAAPDAFDLVLLDWRLPGEDGLAGALRLRASHPGVACALMSGYDEPGLAQRARDCGLVGYFPKALEVEQMLAGLARLAAGGSWFESCAARDLGLLTGRQRQIVQLAARGASNKEIAKALGIAPHTVKNHLARIFEKLGARNRAQASSLSSGR